MIKPLLFSLLSAAVLLAGVSSAHAQQLKVGTVDMKKVFENYYKTKEAEQRINEARNAAKKQMEERMDTYKKLGEEVQKLNQDLERPELSPEAKASRQKQRDEKIGNLKDMEREIREFQANEEKRLNDQTVRMRSGIVDEINKIVADRVKSDQYDLVLDRSGPSMNMVPVVLYARDSYDFTNDVVKTLNQNKTETDPDQAEKAGGTAVATPKPKDGAAIPAKTGKK